MKYFSQFLLFISISVFGQKYSKEFPNYIKAQNGNCVVQIFSSDFVHDRRTSVGGRTSVSSEGVFINSNTFRESHISHVQYKSMGEKTFSQISRVVDEEFLNLGISPSSYFRTAVKDYMDADRMNEMYDLFLEEKPGFIIVIAIDNWQATEAIAQKRVLTSDDIGVLSISITRIDAKLASEAYVYAKQESFTKILSGFEKQFKKTGDDYFIENMQINYDEVFDEEKYKKAKEITTKALKKNESIESYPLENHLIQKTLLVVAHGEKGKANWKRAERVLNKYYPYKYKLVTALELGEYLDKPEYKHMLIGETKIGEKYTFKEANGQVTEQLNTVFLFYYAIKNLQTLDMYYGPDKAKLEAQATMQYALSLKRSLVRMKEFYKWE